MSVRRSVGFMVLMAAGVAPTVATAQTATGECPGATPRDQVTHGWQVQSDGRWVEAERCLRAASESSDHWVRHHRSEITQSLAVIAQHVGELQITGGVPGAQVSVDGVAVGTLPMAQPVRVVAAPVMVQVTATGYHTAERRLTIAAGQLTREAISLAPDVVEHRPEPVAAVIPPVPAVAAPAPTPAPVVVAPTVTPVTPAVQPTPAAHGSTLRTVGWTGVVVGGLALIGGAIVGGMRESAFSSFINNHCNNYTDGTFGPSAATPVGVDCAGLASQPDSLIVPEVALFVGGGVIAATGIIMVLAAPSGSSERSGATAFQCGPGPGTVGMRCGLQF